MPEQHFECGTPQFFFIALRDLFSIERMYGKLEELARTIKEWSVESVELVETRRSPFISPALRLRFMVGTLGLIVGRK